MVELTMPGKFIQHRRNQSTKKDPYFASKKENTKILVFLKKEASNLSRYMHPNVLKILEPFHEDSNVLAFVTEPVECTLAQILD
jgi:hypothetical protein